MMTQRVMRVMWRPRMLKLKALEYRAWVVEMIAPSRLVKGILRQSGLMTPWATYTISLMTRVAPMTYVHVWKVKQGDTFATFALCQEWFMGAFLNEGESLEIDLTIERVKAKSAEEARKVSREALNVAQDNYSEVQSTVEPLINNLDWLQNYGIAHIANSILNSAKLYRVVVALIVAYRAAGHRTRYVECATHVDTALATHWVTRHCSVK
ncbi:hypothetical protein Hanom_Chr07g00611721 [Helianthus anomalus]